MILILLFKFGIDLHNFGKFFLLGLVLVDLFILMVLLILHIIKIILMIMVLFIY
jgi:hypothetical protein